MSYIVQLLGRPRIERNSSDAYQFRSRKSWAILTYLILSEHPPSRSQLASQLFAEADDPIRALRWGLSEIRHALGDEGSIDGDPVVLKLPADAVVDVDVVMRGSWSDAVALPGLGAELLEGMAVKGAAAFETWLLSKQRHLAAVSEAILHEAALGSMSQGALDTAIGYAVRAAAMNPLDENHQILLIRLYRLRGDDEAAARQAAACTETFERELGLTPSHALEVALHEIIRDSEEDAGEATIEALVESGVAAVAAGAIEAGAQSLRIATQFADRADITRLRVNSRLRLGETLIHSLGGLDEEGSATLYEADEVALAAGLQDEVAQARAELGYVEYLRAHYDRAEVRLTEALTFANGSPAVMARATTYLGCVESDRANYRRSAALLEEARPYAQAAGDTHIEAFGLSMLGRLYLLCGNLDDAARQLDDSINLAEREHWLAFVPWPQALRAEVALRRGDVAGASELLEQAFARACQLGNPCWEGISARGLALVAEANGDSARAFRILSDARTRSNRLADPYVWLGSYLLDVQCELGLRHGHPDTRLWVESMKELTWRTGMKELSVRSLLHGAQLGNEGDAIAATMLAAEIESPPSKLRIAADA